MNKFTHKFLSFVLTLAMVLTAVPMFGTPVWATEPEGVQYWYPVYNNEDASTAYDKAASGIKEWKTSSCAFGSYTLVTSGAVTWGAVGEDKWYVASDTNITITSGVSVQGNVHLILMDGCHLVVNAVSGSSKAGIEVTSPNSLTIYSQTNNTNNSGTLTVTGAGEGAGIGGSTGQSGDNITINGGIINAVGGFPYGAGIGGGKGGSASNIFINGGTVTAKSQNSAAGIGGSHWNNCSNIVINGGTVYADYVDGQGYACPGIGAGGDGGTCENITINGGTVTATGGSFSAGIGGGMKSTVSAITINGGVVTATGGHGAAGIGAGNAGTASAITINGGTVTATGGNTYEDTGHDTTYTQGAAIGRGGYCYIGSNRTFSTATAIKVNKALAIKAGDAANNLPRVEEKYRQSDDITSYLSGDFPKLFVKIGYVANVNGTDYPSFADAVAAAKDNEIITLENNSELIATAADFTISKSVTISGAGYTINVATGHSIRVASDTDINVAIENITISAIDSANALVIASNTNITLKEIKTVSTGTGIVIKDNSNVTMSGVIYTTTEGISVEGNSTLDFSGATFTPAETYNNPVIVASGTNINITPALNSYKGKTYINKAVVVPSGAAFDPDTSSGYAMYSTVSEAAIKAAGDSMNAGTVVMIANSSEYVWIPDKKTVTIDLNGFVLSGTGENRVLGLYVKDTVLTVTDSGIDTAVHYYTVSEGGLWVWDDTNTAGAITFAALYEYPTKGAVVAVSGGAVTGGKATAVTKYGSAYIGGGILAQDGAKLILNNVNIIGNSATGFGGGIGYIYDRYSYLQVNGGIIAGNKSDNNGGGLFVWTSACITDAAIKFNTANIGGAIGLQKINNSSQLILAGSADISYNQSKSMKSAISLMRSAGFKLIFRDNVKIADNINIINGNKTSNTGICLVDGIFIDASDLDENAKIEVMSSQTPTAKNNINLVKNIDVSLTNTAVKYVGTASGRELAYDSVTRTLYLKARGYDDGYGNLYYNSNDFNIFADNLASNGGVNADGYKFAGWYDSSTNEKLTSTGYDGNVNAYAMWEKNGKQYIGWNDETLPDTTTGAYILTCNSDLWTVNNKEKGICINDDWTIASDTDLTIDLNGHILDLGEYESEAGTVSARAITNEGTLTLIDNSESKAKNNFDIDDETGLWDYNASGTAMTIIGGAVTGGEVINTGTLSAISLYLCGNTTVSLGGVVNLKDSVIIGNTTAGGLKASEGGVLANGKLILEGNTKIYDNTADLVVAETAEVTVKNPGSGMYIGLYSVAEGKMTPGSCKDYCFADDINKMVISTGGAIELAAAKDVTVKFVANGGTSDGNPVAAQIVSAGAAATAPANMTKAACHFAGWYSDSEFTKPWDFGNELTEDITLYAKWNSVSPDNFAEEVKISVTVDGVATSGELALMNGGYITRSSIAAGSVTIKNLYFGTYEMIFNGINTLSVTDSMTVDRNNTTFAFELSSQAGVVVRCDGNDTPNVAVSGANEFAKTLATATTASVTVIVNVEAEDEKDTPETSVYEIKQLAGGRKLNYLDINVETIVGSETSVITDTQNDVLTFAVPFSFSGKNSVAVYRYHNGNTTAAAFKQLNAKATSGAITDGAFYADTANNIIYIYATKFSTYAVGYSDNVYYEEPSYRITALASENGSISVSKTIAVAGVTVSVTAKADENYTLASITVTDIYGNSVAVKDRGNGTYSFVMPSCKVTVGAEFAKIGSYAVCPQDNTCVFAKYLDTDITAWYHNGVHFCVEKGYMAGYANGNFGPSDTFSRAMVVTLLWNLEGQPCVDYAMSFEDVAADAWYTEAIRWANSIGLVVGYNDQSFGPSDSITREQLAKIYHSYAKYKGIDVSASKELSGFADAAKASGWATDALKWATAVKLMEGKGGAVLDPKGNASRAEAATMLMNYCEKIAK